MAEIAGYSDSGGNDAYGCKVAGGFAPVVAAILTMRSSPV